MIFSHCIKCTSPFLPMLVPHCINPPLLCPVYNSVVGVVTGRGEPAVARWAAGAHWPCPLSQNCPGHSIPQSWTLLSLCLVQIQARGATETLDNLVLLSIFHWGCYPTRGHVATTSRCFEIVSFNYGRTTFEKSFWKASFPCYIPRTAEEQFTK